MKEKKAFVSKILAEGPELGSQHPDSSKLPVIPSSSREFDALVWPPQIPTIYMQTSIHRNTHKHVI